MMHIAILGNSGSGKSTLSKWLAESASLAALDLDSIAWELDQPAVARPMAQAAADVARFCNTHPCWVVEGCYGNFIEVVLPFQPLLIFLNPGLENCLANCQNRPWEAHKYASKQEQDANLEFLLNWVAEYYTRNDSLSLAAHRAIFDNYQGRKVELRRAPQLNPPEAEVLAWLH